MELSENVPLAARTTLGVGGAAALFGVVRSEADAREAVALARTRGVELRVLGGGSNVVIADDGVPGLVVSMANRGCVWGDDGEVTVAAGEVWDEFVASAVSRGLAGVECLSGIPGLVGATPIQNVGAYGQEVSERIERVRLLDRRTGETLELDNASCQFRYRDSFFKSEAPERHLVLAVTFRLSPGGAPSVRYPELERELAAGAAGEPGLARVRDTVIELRRRKSMVLDPQDENGRSCGSFFVNPIVDATAADQVAARAGVAELPRYPQPDGSVKLSAAWLIERAGLVRGTRDGNVGLSTKHSLCIVAHPGARAADIRRFAERVRLTVRDQLGVQLEPEPVHWGFEA